jgi:hypothetical protein
MGTGENAMTAISYDDGTEYPSPFDETPTNATVTVDGKETDVVTNSVQGPSAMLMGELDDNIFGGGALDARPWKRPSSVAFTAPLRGETASAGAIGAAAESAPPDGAQGPKHKFFTSENILGHILTGVGAAVTAAAAAAGGPIGMMGGAALMRAGGDISNKEEANIEYGQAEQIASIKATQSRGTVYHPPIAQIMEQGGIAAWQGPGVYTKWQEDTREMIRSNPPEYAYMAPTVELPYEAQLAARGAKTNNMKQSIEFAKMLRDTGNLTMANALLKAIYGTTQVGEVRLKDQADFVLDALALQSVPEDFLSNLINKDVSYTDALKMIDNIRELTLRDPAAGERLSKALMDAQSGMAENVYEDTIARETAQIDAAEAARKGDVLVIPDLVAEEEAKLNKDPAYIARLKSLTVALGADDPVKLHRDEMSIRIRDACMRNNWTPTQFSSLSYWAQISYKLAEFSNGGDDKLATSVRNTYPEWLRYITAWNFKYGFSLNTTDENELHMLHLQGYNEYINRQLEQNTQSKAPK